MYIFVITSTLNPKIGLLSPEVRYEQTLNTIKSIREKANGSLILLVDSSPQPVEQTYIDDIKSKVDYFITLSNHTHAIELGNAGLKSPAECYVMVIALDIIRNLALPDIKRVFKITGRGELTDRFNIEDYDNPEMNGKYVFKASVESWMARQLRLVDTRLWSFDYKMFEEVNQLVRDAYSDCMATRMDLEHTYYKLIDKQKLFEKDVIGMKCQLASDGVIIDE
jgi:hypothetical protein